MYRGWLFLWAVFSFGCTAGSDRPAGDEIETRSSALTGPIQNDFEDGTLQGWIPRGPVTLTNTTAAAFNGTHSLLTTGRTAGFNGPSLNLTGQLAQGATYSISVAVRLVAGQAPTTIRMTMQRTLSDGTTQAFDTIAQNTNVTDAGWVTLSAPYSFSAPATALLLYVEATSATASYYIDAFSLSQGLFFDFEDGTTQGWGTFGNPTVANSIDVANTGTHSLKTTNRSASFNGPSLNVQTLLTKGATYQITVSARLVAGQPASTLLASVARTPTGGSTAFDTVASATNVTDAAWVTFSGLYSFTTTNSSLIFYVQTSSGTASYYIDTVSIAQVAPPPGPPGNTNGASANFESGTLEGWKSRTGGESVNPSNADAHGGSFSLLTSNRTAAFQGPAFDVTNVMFNGSRYVVSVWAKLAPGQPSSQLRVSLQRTAGTINTFHTVVGNTTVTADAWVRLQATYDVALANSTLTLYVESASGTASFYIDDFSITFVVPPIAERNIPSVYQSMAQFFPVIGAAVLPADITGEPGFLLSKHFNSITSGNDMKWDATEPTEGNFTFNQADAEVAFAQTNNMKVRGHTLIWHNQTPAWVFLDASGNPMTATPANQALLTQRIQNHIQAVMTHFDGKVTTWDVVNEPIDPSQPDGYRRSPWFNILGKQYIDIAFQAARAANPNAKLYINDFDTTNPAHRDPLLAVVRDLKSRGIPIDGVGHQMHNNIEYPSPQSVIDAVNLFDTTGVEQAITEMDVSIYSGSFPTPFTSYTDIPQSRHNTVGYSYSGFIQALKQVSSKIASITIWGTSDDKSWLTSSTKVDAPLLFDPSLQKKPAYWAFVDPLQLPGADLSTDLSAAPAVVAAGQGVAYTITVTNNADTNEQPFDPTNDDLPAANVSMTMAIPAHTGFASLTPPTGWSCATPAVGASGQITCTVGTLAVGAAAQFALTVAVNDCSTPDATTVVGSAKVTSTTADPNPAPNNTKSASVQVSNPPPVITANGSLNTTVECHTSYTDAGATATDACDGPVAVSSSSNVDVNTVGTYAVSYNASDSAGGHAATVVRTVQVADTTPPLITANGSLNTTVECHTSYTDAGATALDACVGPVPVSSSSNVDVNTVGTYAVSYNASDNAGNPAATVVRAVQVADTTPPQMSVVSDSAVMLIPPDHTYRTVAIGSLVTAASDTCDASVGVGSVVITQVTSDEPDNGNGDGNTVGDIVIAADCRSVQLRSERAGPLNGRVYKVTLRVTDASGNSTIKSVKVTVPLSDPTVPAVDDGVALTVLSACH
jgi:endo-1,4-beta-xylanase